METPTYIVTVIDRGLEVQFVTEAANAQIAKATARAFFASARIVRVEVQP